MKFKCRCCGKYEEPIKKALKGYEMLAYDRMVSFTNFKDEKDIDVNNYEVMEKSPCKDEMCILKVHFPFNFEVGDRFNMLFRPANSYYNGWDEDYSEEISQSAIVSCKFEKEILSYEENGFIWAKTEDVILLPDLIKRFPEHHCGKSFDEWKKGYNDEYKYSDEWTEYSWNAQGDCGVWNLIYTDKNGRRHLLLLCSWGFHYDNISCGNIVFDE